MSPNKSQANAARSEKMTGNQNAAKDESVGMRVPVVLSIADKRKTWATKRLQAQGIEHPTQADIIRYTKDFCYGKIDEDIKTQQ